MARPAAEVCSLRRVARPDMRMGRRAPCVCPVSYIARPLRTIRMEAFLVSTGAVLLGEIGDKTMLLALVLAPRFRKPMPAIAGTFVPTGVNHHLAGQVVGWLRAVSNPET